MISKKSNSTQGFALVAVLAVIFILIAVGGAGYYVMTKNKDTASNGNSILSNEEQDLIEKECKQQIDDDDFCRFASNWSFGGEYKIIVKTSGGDGSGTFTSEVNGDNSSTVMVSDNGEESRFIYLNGTSYVYDSESEVWIKYPSVDESIGNLTDEYVNEFDFDESDVPEEDRTEYKSLGKEACGDRNCFKYQIIDPASPNSEQYVWFDDKDYAMRKFVSIDDGVTTEMTIEYQSVVINEPSPVEEFSLPEGTPTEAELQELIDSYQ
jgi:outer membrane lipoprotein-sorting protein